MMVMVMVMVHTRCVGGHDVCFLIAQADIEKTGKKNQIMYALNSATLLIHGRMEPLFPV